MQQYTPPVGTVEPPAEKAPPADNIKISNKRPLFFYVSEASRALEVHPQVEISGLGGAVPTVVTIVEILKTQGICQLKSVNTSMVTLPERGHIQKPKIEIVVVKSEKFNEVQAQRKKLSEENTEIHALVTAAQRTIQASFQEPPKTPAPETK